MIAMIVILEKKIKILFLSCSAAHIAVHIHGRRRACACLCGSLIHCLVRTTKYCLVCKKVCTSLSYVLYIILQEESSTHTTRPTTCTHMYQIFRSRASHR